VNDIVRPAPVAGTTTSSHDGLEDDVGRTAGACPRRRSDLRARVVEGEVIVLDRQRELVHQLNTTAGYIWDRCDGHHSVAVIARDLAGVFDVEVEAAQRDVADAVRKLEAAGLVDTRRR
jgi:hypothetical protein